jgi:hypothetical protein
MFTIGRTITTTAIATTAAAVTFLVPGPGAAIPVDVPAPRTDTVEVERPCYLARPGWNTPGGWEQPVCHTEVRARVADTAPAVRRPAEDHMP